MAEQKRIDFVSDTVTLPTKEMREAMFNAEVGDDVLEEDPTINKLESLAAKKIGKEAALFVPSGTMGNTVAILTHCKRGHEIIVEKTSHIFEYEVGGVSSLAGVMPHIITAEKGIFNPRVIENAIREEDIHYPETGLICLENTHNRQGGTVTPLDTMKEIYHIAHNNNIPVHLDGARIFNAALFLEIDAVVIAKYADSVMFCLSKGLCAPVGSILAGNKEFIMKARKNRKLLGGGMRQAGFLAAAGIVALEKMIDRLREDHENARRLAEGLFKIDGLYIDMERVQTNMVYVHVDKLGISSNQFIQKLDVFNVRCERESPTEVRFVTHYGINQKDIDTTIEAIRKVVRNI